MQIKGTVLCNMFKNIQILNWDQRDYPTYLRKISFLFSLVVSHHQRSQGQTVSALRDKACSVLDGDPLWQCPSGIATQTDPNQANSSHSADCQWSNHLPSSVTDVWYPCGSVTCTCTLGLSMFSLASVPGFPPSGAGVLKMLRGAGRGSWGGDGARAFIFFLAMTKKRHSRKY